METGHPSTRAVNSASGNRALLSWTLNSGHVTPSITYLQHKFWVLKLADHVTNIIGKTRFWALGALHNSRLSLDRLLQFLTVWPWPLTFGPILIDGRGIVGGVSLRQIWRLYTFRRFGFISSNVRHFSTFCTFWPPLGTPLGQSR